MSLPNTVFWIQTHSGLAFDFNDPTANVTPNDVAEALSKINRFTGHTHYPSTVAEHSVRAAIVAWHLTGNHRTALLALCHDAGEAYVGDISYPLKRMIATLAPTLGHVLEKIEREVVGSLTGKRYDDAVLWPTVKEVDLLLLEWESRTRLPGGRVGHWPVLERTSPIDFDRELHASPNVWRDMWLVAYADLTAGREMPYVDDFAISSRVS